MKWSIVGLFCLGFIAALCAAVLVASLNSSVNAADRPSQERRPDRVVTEFTDVPILVASGDLEAMTVVTADVVKTKTVPQDIAPEGAYTDPVQLVGRVLRAPVKAEQAFTPKHLASEGSSLHLATALASGMRAVSISLTDSMGVEDLLYPGCVVDVLASMTLKEDEGLGAQPISMTILQGVTVLAVGEKTIVSPSDDNVDEQGRPLLQRGPRPKVTLLVNPHEAETLKLAMESGSVSLTMRNPMDEGAIRPEGTRLARISPLFATLESSIREKELAKAAEEARTQELTRERDANSIELDRLAMERARTEHDIAVTQLEAEKIKVEEALEETEKEPPMWDTLIVRGGVAETKSFELEEAAAAKAEGSKPKDDQ